MAVNWSSTTQVERLKVNSNPSFRRSLSAVLLLKTEAAYESKILWLCCVHDMDKYSKQLQNTAQTSSPPRWNSTVPSAAAMLVFFWNNNLQALSLVNSLSNSERGWMGIPLSRNVSSLNTPMKLLGSPIVIEDVDPHTHIHTHIHIRARARGRARARHFALVYFVCRRFSCHFKFCPILLFSSVSWVCVRVAIQNINKCLLHFIF